MHRFTPEMVDSAIEALFPRDIAERLKERVERSVGRVVGADLTISDNDLDEIVDGLMGEEYDNLPLELRQALDGGLTDEVVERLKDIVRPVARKLLRNLCSQPSA